MDDDLALGLLFIAIVLVAALVQPRLGATIEQLFEDLW